MKTFKNGPLASWKQVKAGDVIPFLSRNSRRVKFQVVANSPIEIWAASDDKMSDGVLVGATGDKACVEYTHIGNSYVMIKAEKNSAVYMNAPDIDQTIAESDKPSFTSIEPRVRNSTELDRMMQLMKYNTAQNEAMLKKERDLMRAEMAQLRLEQTKADVAADMVVEPDSDDSGAETAS